MHLIVPYRRSGGPDFFPIRRGPKRGNLRHIPGSDVNLNAAPPGLCAAFHRPTEPDRQPRPANGSFLAADRPHSSEVRSILLPIRALPRRLTLLVGVVRMFVRRDLRRSADEDRLENGEYRRARFRRKRMGCERNSHHYAPDRPSRCGTQSAGTIGRNRAPQLGRRRNGPSGCGVRCRNISGFATGLVV